MVWYRAMYRIGSSVVLTAGRDVPEVGRVRQRGEEVAIVLSAWRNWGFMEGRW